MKKFGLAVYTDTFEDGLTVALDRGIGIEIQTFTDPNVLGGDWQGILKDYKEVLEKKPPAFLTLHAPYIDLAPLVQDPFVRDAVVKRIEWAFDVAKELQAGGIVVHLSTAMRRIDYNLDLWLDRQHHFWLPFTKRAESEGLTLYLENSYEPDPAFLVLLYDILDSEAVKLCFDYGHAEILSGGTIKEWFEAADQRIGYLHLHNNDGHSDLHASLGDGVLDFKTLLTKADCVLEPQTIAIIEVDTVTDMVASLKYLDEIGCNPNSRGD